MRSQNNSNVKILFVLVNLYSCFWLNPFSKQKKETRVSFLGSYWIFLSEEPNSLSQWCIYISDEVCLRSSCLHTFPGMLLVTFGPSHMPTHCHAAVCGFKKLPWLRINHFLRSETQIIPEANLFSLAVCVYTSSHHCSAWMPYHLARLTYVPSCQN